VEELDQFVRRGDEDRWLSSRFAPAQVRERLIAIYAVNHEIARVAGMVREAALGDMRLAWWRSELDLVAQGHLPSSHPALAVLYATAAQAAPSLMTIAEARAADMESAPFKTWSDLDRYVSRTGGLLMTEAAAACGAALCEGFRERACLAWAYVGLLRAAPLWTGRGRSFLPAGATVADMLTRARAAYADAKAHSAALPIEAFPAYGHVALVPGYIRALEQGRRETPQLGRKAMLIAASARGRI